MKLPEKWAIKTDNQEFYDFFNQLPDVDKGVSYPYRICNGYLHYPSYDDYLDCYASETKKQYYTEITFEQLTQSEEWKAWKEKKDVVLDFGDHKVRIVNNEKREIICYKAPFDMYINTNIEVIKDTIFTKRNLVYWNEKCNVNFPAELVEKYFIPVYKETKEDVEHEIDLILGCYSTSTYKDKEEFNRVIEKLKPLFKKLEELK